MRRLICAALGVILLAAVAACSGDSSPAQQQRQQQSAEQTVEASAGAAVESARQQAKPAVADPDNAQAAAAPDTERQAAPDEPVVLAPNWSSNAWRPLRRVAEDNAALQAEIDREIEWCRASVERGWANDGGHWSEPNEDGESVPLAGPTLLAADDHPWIALVAEAMAEERSIALETTPAVWLTSPEWQRAELCRAVVGALDGGRPEQPSPHWRLLTTLGINGAGWGPTLLGYLGSVQELGRYEPQRSSPARQVRGAGGRITLLAPTPPNTQTASVLAHEMVHHLQYQLIGGGDADAWPPHGTHDRYAVLHWLIEADATLAMLAMGLATGSTAFQAAVALLGDGGASPAEAVDLFGRLPLEWSEPFYGPYRRAEEFVGRLMSWGDPGVIDRMLRDLPDSTEQLLHAEKYDADEQPLDLSPLQPLIDAAVSDEWTRPGAPLLVDRRDQDTLGELYLRLLISASTGREGEARSAAAGWGGDRLHIFERDDGGALVVWAVAFDDAEEHAEGVVGLREWLIAFSEGEAWGLDGGRVIGWDAAQGAVRVLDWLGTVWLIVGPDAATADAVVGNLLAEEMRLAWWS